MTIRNRIVSRFFSITKYNELHCTNYSRKWNYIRIYFVNIGNKNFTFEVKVTRWIKCGISINKNGERSSKDCKSRNVVLIYSNEYLYAKWNFKYKDFKQPKLLNFVLFCTQDVLYPDFYIFKFYVLLPPTYLHLYNQHLKRYNNPSKSD